MAGGDIWVIGTGGTSHGCTFVEPVVSNYHALTYNLYTFVRIWLADFIRFHGTIKTPESKDPIFGGSCCMSSRISCQLGIDLLSNLTGFGHMPYIFPKA